jgi:hypothetical protein
MAAKKSNRSRLVGCGALLLIAASFLGWMVYDARPKAAKFPLELPPTAQLLNSFKHRGSISDWTFAFEFAVEDAQLRDLLIREWDLDIFSGNVVPSGFASGLSEYWSIDWWPTEEELDATPEQYRRDDDRQRYWMVWYDPTAKRLYVEYGNT